MRVYADNDFIHKLAVCDLLSQIMDVLHIMPADVHVLGTARYKFCLNNPTRGKSKFGERVFDGIKDFLEAATVIQGAPDPDDQDALTGILDIDPGELILASFASRDPESMLATGDKRFCRALSDPRATATKERLRARVLCLEQAVQRLIRHCGFDEIRQLVVPGMQCDAALRAAFGSGMDALETTVVEVLASYVLELRTATTTLLVLD